MTISTNDAFANLRACHERLRQAIYEHDERGVELARKACTEAERVLRAAGRSDGYGPRGTGTGAHLKW